MPVSEIQQLKEDQHHSLTSARKIRDKARKEGRRPTAEETEQIHRWMDEVEEFDKDISVLERLEGYDTGLASAVRGASVEEDEVQEIRSVPMSMNGSRETSADPGLDSSREEEEEDPGDPYQTRWDTSSGAREFRDMSITAQRGFFRAGATRDYNTAFYSYLRGRTFNARHVGTLEHARAAMVEGVDLEGGYLAPTQLVGGILKEAQVLEELKPRMDVIRSNARSLTYTEGLDAVVMGWIPELGTKPEDALTFGRRVLVPHVAAVVLWVSDELLEDETYGLQGYIQARVSEGKTLLEEEAFVSGSGTGRPRGILTALNAEATTPNRYTTQVAATLSANDIIRIPYTMPVQYRRNGTYILGTNAIRTVRLQRDDSGAAAGTGGYIWQPSLQAGEPATLNGYPVIETTSVALNSAVATGNDVGIFGDLRRYRVFERLGLQVKRLEELRALTDEVGFRFRFRTGGDVMLTKAFRSIRVL